MTRGTGLPNRHTLLAAILLALLPASRESRISESLESALNRVRKLPAEAGASPISLEAGEFVSGGSRLGVHGAAVRVQAQGAPALTLAPASSPLRIGSGLVSGASVIYPAGDSALALTPHPGGVQEDIVLTRPLGDRLEFAWLLGASALAPRLESDGSIGVYSGKKLIYTLATPFVRDAHGREHRELASLELRERQVMLHASGLSTLDYPITIDPTVVVSTTAGFALPGQSEGNAIIANAEVVRGQPGINSIGPFTGQGSLPVSMYAGCSVTVGGRLYFIDSQNSKNVYVATPTAGGATGGFSTAGALPSTRAYPGCTAYNGYLYVLGGYEANSFADVLVAPINPDGTIGTFTATNPMPDGRGEPTAVAANGFLYVLGGFDGANTTPPNLVANDVLYAQLNADGTVGAWNSGAPFATPRTTAGAAVLNNRLYVYGGSNSASTQYADAQFASINPSTGAVGTWVGTTPLPQPLAQFVYGESNGTLFAVAGEDASGASTGVSYFATISSQGQIGSWNTGPALSGASRVAAFGGVLQGYVFVGGGVALNPSVILSDYASAPIAGSGVASWSTSGAPIPYTNPHGPIYNGYLYYMDCRVRSDFTFGPTVMQFAPINADGTLGAFQSTSAPSQQKYLFATEAWNGYIYAISGDIDGGVQYASINSDGTLNAWQSTSGLNQPRWYHSSAVHNGYLYVFGGQATGINALASVEYAQINPDGSLGAWTVNPNPLPSARGTTGVAVSGDHVYLTGGFTAALGYTDETIVATFNADGSVSAWTETTPLPQAMEEASMAVLGGTAYVLGGYPGGSAALSTVLAASINVDGTLSNWSSTTSLPAPAGEMDTRVYNGRMYTINPTNMFVSAQITSGALGAPYTTTPWPADRYGSGTVAASGYLYLAGGFTALNASVTTIDFAPINSGTLGSWATTTPLPLGIGYEPLVENNGYLYTIGGEGGQSPGYTYLNEIYYSPINANGSLGAWQTSANTFSGARTTAGAAVWNNKLYVVGGYDYSEGGSLADVQFATFNSDGSLGAFAETSAMNQARANAAAVAYGGYLYAMGHGGASASDTTVEIAPILGDGSLGAWAYATSLPATNDWYRYAYAADGYLYVADTQRLYSSAIAADGSLGGWMETISFPGAATLASHAVYDGYVYRVLGADASEHLSAEVDVAPLLGPRAQGAYSRLFDFGALQAEVNSIKLTGAFPGNTDLTVRSADASGVFGALTDLGNVSSGTTVNLNISGARYLWTHFAFDDGSVATVTPDGAGQSVINAITVTTAEAPPTIVNPSTIDFGAQAVGSSSSGAIYVSNGGSAPLNVSAITLSDNTDYAVSPDTATTLSPGATLTLTVTFTPSAPGALDGALTFTTDSGAQSVSLTGSGAEPAPNVACPAAFTQRVGSTSGPMDAVVANPGTVALSLQGPVISGADASDFAVTPLSATSIPASGSANFAVTFNPGTQGARTATLSFTSNAGPASCALSGTGTYPQTLVEPASISFPAQPAGVPSSPFDVYVSNTGTASISVSAPLLSDSIDYSISPASATQLDPGATATYAVTFTPSTQGTLSGTLTFATDNGTTAVSLSGVGANASGTGGNILVNNGSSFRITGNDEGGAHLGNVVNRFRGGALGPWSSVTSLPVDRGEGTSTLAVNGFLYTLGGYSITSSGVTNSCYYAPINTDGSLGTWTQTSSFSTARYEQASAAYNGYVYILGGSNAVIGTVYSDVQFAKVNPDGSLSAFTATTSLPQGLDYAQATAYNGYLYITGGYAYSGAETVSSAVYVAPINGDGTLGSWTATTSLPSARAGHSLAAFAGRLYVAGGVSQPAPAGFLQDTKFATIDPTTGLLGSWTSTTPMPTALYGQATVAQGGYLYLLAGTPDDSTFFSSGIAAPFESDGNLGAWFNLPAFPNGRFLTSAASDGNFVFLLGGDSSGDAAGSQVLSAPIQQSGLAPWNTSQPTLSGARGTNCAVAYSGFIYSVGGESTVGSPYYADVQYAPVGSDGTLGSFVTSPNALPQGRGEMGCAAYNGFLYVTGGTPQNNTGFSDVLYAPINIDGSIGAFTTSPNQFSTGRFSHQTVVHGGYLYVMGGEIYPATASAPTYYGDIQAALINPDGSIGAFANAGNLPTARAEFGALVYGERLYLAGGRNDPSGATRLGDVQAASFGSNGAVGSFAPLNSLATPRSFFSFAALDGALYVIGGVGGITSFLDDVQTARVNLDGSIGAWASTNTTSLTVGAGTGVANGTIYLVGGYTTLSGYSITNSVLSARAAGFTAALGPWSNTAAFDVPRSGAGVVAYNGYIYALGGQEPGVGNLNTVIYSKIQSDGTLGAWNQTSPFNGGRLRACTFQYNGSIYLVGGGNTATLSDTQMAPINSDGTLGAWASAGASIPIGLQLSACVVKNGILYMAGGSTGDGSGVTANVYIAPIGSDGKITAFNAGPSLPSPREYVNGAEYNGYLYFVSGYLGGSGASQVARDVLVNHINPDGSLGSWQETAQLNTPRLAHVVYPWHGHLFVFAGGSASGDRADIEESPILSDGTLAGFQPAGSMPAPGEPIPSIALYSDTFYVANGSTATGLSMSRLTNDPPAHATYSRLFDLGSAVTNIDTLTLSGSTPGAASLHYSLAGENGLFAPAVNAGAVSFGSVIPISQGSNARYLFMRLFMDDSTAVAINADAPVSTLSSISLGYSNAPTLIVEPSALDFGTEAVNVTTGASLVYVSNPGSATLQLSAPVVTGDFASSSGAQTLTTGQTGTYAVTFTPTASGARSGTLSFTANGAAESVALSGNGVAPVAAITCPGAFASPRGLASSSQQVTIGNSGSGALLVSGFTLSGANAADFAVSPTASASISQGSNGSWQVSFTPSEAAAETATLTFTTNDASDPTTCSLSGVGQAASPSLSATSLNLGSVRKGTTGTATRSVTITNSGDVAMSVSAASFTGTNASDFAVSPTSGAIAASGGTLQFTVSFKPGTAAAESATLNFTSASGSPAVPSVPVSGAGIYPALSVQPVNIAFADQAAGTSSAPQTLVVTNTGSDILNFAASGTSEPVLSGANSSDFILSPAAGALPQTLAAGASISFTATFAPQANSPGSRGAALAIANIDGLTSPSINLSGAVPSLSPSSMAIPDTVLGSTTTSNAITLSNPSSTAPLAITSALVSGTNASDFVLSTGGPSSIAPGGTGQWSVVFAPSLSGNANGRSAESATLTIVTPAGSFSCALSSNSLYPVASVAWSGASSFPSTPVGATSGTILTAVITNNGAASLKLNGLPISGTDASDFAITSTIPSTGSPISIAAGASSNVTVSFKPAAAPARAESATLAFTSNGGSPTLALAGTGTQAVASISPSVLTLVSATGGGVRKGTTSVSQTVTITNSGNTSMGLSGVNFSGANPTDFTVSPTPSAGNPITIASGSNNTAQFSVTFTPKTASAESTTLTFTAAAGSPSVPSVALSGNGIYPALSVQPASVAFGSQAKGTNSAAASVEITNTGSDTLNVSAIALSDNTDFVFSPALPTLPLQLSAGASRTLGVVFSPQSAAALGGTLTVTSSDFPSSPGAVSLSGTGVLSTPSLSPGSLSLPDTALGSASSTTPSVSNTVTLGNTGGAALAINSVTLSGVNKSDFSAAGGASSIAAGQSANWVVVFKPSAAGPETATLTIATDNGSYTSSLSASGVNIAPAPASLSFGSQRKGVASASQAVSITNSGTAALGISAASSSSADFAISLASGSTLPIAAGKSATWNIAFTPSSAGAESASLSFTTNLGNSSVALSGAGIYPALSVQPGLGAFGNQRVQTPSAALDLVITNTGSDTLDLSAPQLSDSTDYSITLSDGGSVAQVDGGSALASLAQSASTTLLLKFHPQAKGPAPATLTVGSSDAAISAQSVSLSGNGTSPNPQLSATSLAFGAQAVGVPSASKSVLVTNPSGAAVDTLNITDATISPIDLAHTADAADFTITPPSSGAVAPGSAGASWMVVFQPSSPARAESATLTLQSDAGPLTVALGGTGIAAAVSASPTNLAFAAQPQGTSSQAQALQLINSGSASLSISSYGLSGANVGDFSVSTSASSLTPPGSATLPACTAQPCPAQSYYVVFTPSTANAESATLTFQTSAGPVAIALLGAGVGAALAFNPSSVDFGSERVDSSSSAVAVTVTNATAAQLTLDSFELGGANANDFSVALSGAGAQFPVLLPSGGSATLLVDFTPSAVGPRSATLAISGAEAGSDAGTAGVLLPLSGLGIAPTLDIAPSSLAFGQVLVGSTSSSQTVTIANNGTDALGIEQLTLAGSAAASFSVSTSSAGFPLALAVGDSLPIEVTYSPSTVGTSSANLVITTDDPLASTAQVPLGGEGVSPQISIAPTSLSFGATRVGGASLALSLLLTNSGGAATNLDSATFSGAAAADYSLLGLPSLPFALESGGVESIVVLFTPAVHGDREAQLTLQTDTAQVVVGLSGSGLAAGVGVQPAALDFGSLALGAAPKLLSLQIQNTGDAPLDLSLLSIDGVSAAAFRATGVPDGGPLAPDGGVATFSVEYAPSEAATDSATLHIDSSDPSTPGVGVPLSGVAVTPTLTVGGQLTFAATKVGSVTAPQQATITNTSSAALVIESVSAAPGDFSATLAGAPVTLAAQATTSVTVTFTPAKPGAITGTLSVFVEGLPTAIATTQLAGTGQQPASSSGCGCSTSAATDPGALIEWVLFASLAWRVRRRRMPGPASSTDRP